MWRKKAPQTPNKTKQPNKQKVTGPAQSNTECLLNSSAYQAHATKTQLDTSNHTVFTIADSRLPLRTDPGDLLNLPSSSNEPSNGDSAPHIPKPPDPPHKGVQLSHRLTIPRLDLGNREGSQPSSVRAMKSLTRESHGLTEDDINMLTEGVNFDSSPSL